MPVSPSSHNHYEVTWSRVEAKLMLKEENVSSIDRKKGDCQRFMSNSQKTLHVALNNFKENRQINDSKEKILELSNSLDEIKKGLKNTYSHLIEKHGILFKIRALFPWTTAHQIKNDYKNNLNLIKQMNNHLNAHFLSLDIDLDRNGQMDKYVRGESGSGSKEPAVLPEKSVDEPKENKDWRETSFHNEDRPHELFYIAFDQQYDCKAVNNAKKEENGLSLDYGLLYFDLIFKKISHTKPDGLSPERQNDMVNILTLSNPNENVARILTKEEADEFKRENPSLSALVLDQQRFHDSDFKELQKILKQQKQR